MRPATTYVARDCARGFTLVELMVTILVGAVLVSIAIPSFRNLSASSALTAAADDIVGAINSARMEAVKRNASAQFCSDMAASNGSDALGAACGTQAGAVYVWTTGNPATSQVLAGTSSVRLPVQLHGNFAALRFNGQGLGYAAGTSGAPFSGTVVDLCASSLSSNNHRVVAVATGSIITTTTTTGTCP
jgi:type IV fimbrial biogenesis protein FimT